MNRLSKYLVEKGIIETDSYDVWIGEQFYSRPKLLGDFVYIDCSVVDHHVYTGMQTRTFIDRYGNSTAGYTYDTDDFNQDIVLDGEIIHIQYNDWGCAFAFNISKHNGYIDIIQDEDGIRIR